MSLLMPSALCRQINRNAIFTYAGQVKNNQVHFHQNHFTYVNSELSFHYRHKLIEKPHSESF